MLHYEVTDVTAPWHGEAETIIFHHGVGITSDIWLEWLAPLADRYRLVRMDCRGFGRSPIPPPGFPWSMAGLANDVLEVARAAGAERFTTSANRSVARSASSSRFTTRQPCGASRCAPPRTAAARSSACTSGATSSRGTAWRRGRG